LTFSCVVTNDEQISQETDCVEEAASIGNSLTVMTNAVHESIEQNEEISNTALTTLNAAVEHFCARLQYKKKVVPSLESFKLTNRIDQTQIAYENLKELNSSLKIKLAISQEGLFDKLTNAIEKKFTSTEKILKQIELLKGKEAREAVVLKDQAWASIFNPKGVSSELNATDVIAYFKAISLDSRREIFDIFSKTENYMQTAKKLMVNYTSFEQRKITSKLENMLDDIDELVMKFRKKYIDDINSEHKPANIITASTAQISQLSEIVLKALDQTEFQKRYASFEKNAYSAYSVFSKESLI